MTCHITFGILSIAYLLAVDCLKYGTALYSCHIKEELVNIVMRQTFYGRKIRKILIGYSQIQKWESIY